jgi:hypothetical protein
VYIITDTNSKVLTPTDIVAYHEISYNGVKNSTVNNIPTQIPLKGTAIFFVNGNTGYTLLYLAKQRVQSKSSYSTADDSLHFRLMLLMVLLVVATNKYSQQGITDNEILNTYKFLDGVEKMN